MQISWFWNVNQLNNVAQSIPPMILDFKNPYLLKKEDFYSIPLFCVLAQKSFANAKSVRTQENGIFQVDSLPCPWGSSCRKLFFAKLLLRPFQLFLLTILSTVLERVFSLYDIKEQNSRVFLKKFLTFPE